MPLPFTAGADAQYGRLVAQLVATPAPRLTLLNHTEAEKTTILQNILEESDVRAHFSGRCVFVSCGDAASAEVATACVASALDLEPNEDIIATVLEDFAAHDRTLIVLDNVNAIYSSADAEQQEATDVMLATLAAMDEVTLVITYCGSQLPECVAWTSMTDATDDAANTEPQTARLPQQVMTPTTASTDMTCATQNDQRGSVLKTTHAVVCNDVPVSSHCPVTVTGSDGHEREPSPTRTSVRPLTIVQSKVPPPKPAVFHGRDKEVERLVALSMVPSTAPLGIVGSGGIGKTTLALKVLHDPRVKQHFGRQRFFLTCEGANSVDEVLSLLAGKLDVQRPQNAPLWPAVLDNLRARQRILLLIDNFESIWSPVDHELREASEVFLAQLAALDELTLVVTTRGNILPENFTWANIDTAELDTLSSTAARMTFTDLSDFEPHILESEPEANALTELLREIDFMPLAIKLLARLGDLPSRLLCEWSEHYTAVLEADRHDGSRRELSVAVSIRISLEHLAAESADFRPRQLLSVLGQLPAGLFSGVSASLCSTIPKLDSAAQDLLHHSLVYTGGYGELRMLSPVRHYVSACLPMSAATLSALDEIYTNVAQAHPPRELMDIDGPAYDVELPNIFHVLGLALDRRMDITLVITLNIAHYCTLRHQTCALLMQQLAPHVDRHAVTKARFLYIMASHHREQGELNLAVQSLEQSAELYAHLGDKLHESTARGALSAFLWQLGRYEDSSQQNSRSQALIRECEESPYQYRLVPGEELALAEQRFRDLREVHAQAGDGPAVTELSNLILSMVKDQGDESAYTKELEVVVAKAEQTRPGCALLPLGAAKAKLATMYLKHGRIDGVEDLLVDAYALFSSMNLRDGMASVIGSLAILRQLQGRPQDGEELLKASFKMFNNAGIVLPRAGRGRETILTRKHITSSD